MSSSEVSNAWFIEANAMEQTPMNHESNEREEQLLDMESAAKLVPSKPSPAAVWRWCRKGVVARNGKRICLEHRRYGRRLFTTRAALDAFAKAIAEADQEQLAVPTIAKPVLKQQRADDRRRADVDAASERLAGEGF